MRCRKFSLLARISASLSIARIAGTLFSQVGSLLHGFLRRIYQKSVQSAGRSSERIEDHADHARLGRRDSTERLQRYAASGMSRAGMLAQLNLAGYPTELLQQRFPEMSGRRLRHRQADQPTPSQTGQGTDRPATNRRPDPRCRTRLAKARGRPQVASSRPRHADRPPHLRFATRNTAATEVSTARA